MKNAAIGIFAHVDAGKTTLCEAMMFECGELRSLGRVDHGNAFLDTHHIERKRGITVFSKQAIMHYDGLTITLLDTPGHSDFSTEAERTLQVLDCAIVVISGPDGPQSHTETLWHLLEHYEIPTFVFVNKMDQDGADPQEAMRKIQERLGDSCLDFSHTPSEELFEAAAMASEECMDEFLENGSLCTGSMQALIAQRKLFPCFFGSALKVEGVKEFLQGMVSLIPVREWPDDFGAKIFKITHDDQGNRLAWTKITGGSLKVKSPIQTQLPSGETLDEKINQIRIYSGSKFCATDIARAGQVCAITGLSAACSGDGLGFEQKSDQPVLEPVLAYKVIPANADDHKTLQALKTLSEEDPMLRVAWHEQLQEIRLQLMGVIQLEVIRQLMLERFGIQIEFGQGGVLYKETILSPVKGIGHFEPLRHYAETQVLLEPTDPGNGMSFGSVCSEDFLDRNWQRLIATHLVEREHIGVLTGSPITDIRITILAGQAHPKHTNGGDFRQATYRAIRQGLMQAESQLLEPWYRFRLEAPQDQIGRAMADIQRMCGTFDAQIANGTLACLEGFAPVSEMQGYSTTLNAYSHGEGRISCIFDGYRPCHNPKQVIEAIGYDPETDLENSPDSVFCSHGAGFTVKWHEAWEYAHVNAEACPKTPWRKVDASFFSRKD